MAEASGIERAARDPAREPGIDWAALARPEAFPGDPSAAGGVEWIQTHLSHVYRTADRVYKFRKPVDLGFVRFLSRAERNADCLREVALNRRLAPDVYLGVAPLMGIGASPHVGSVAESLAVDVREHCVVMRRLPDGRDALSLLAAGKLTGGHLDAFAARLARFHAAHGLGAPAPFSREEWLARCTGPAEENLRVFEQLGHPDLVARADLVRARSRLRAFLAERADRFERRRRDGRAVDAHGDLHLQHVWYERGDADPIAIDCLEFSEGLRRIDAASDAAFLAMDLSYRGAGALAERFLRSYARESDDYDLYSVVDYFISYRAGVRAKVAALAARDPAIEPGQRERAAESARRHLALAVQAIERRARPALVLVGGVVGTGKSTVAAELADALSGVVVSSDRVRKRLLGAPATARVGGAWRTGAYSAEQTDRTYDGLLTRARPVLESGRVAIVDATWSRRAHREAALRLGEELGVAAAFVEVRCAADVARERLARRAAAGTDASDAGPEHHAESARAFETAAEWPAHRCTRLETDREDWRSALPSLAAWVHCLSH
jgi:aminoglycoside phosphotransferase family enzyme/predicted kinase